MAKREMKTHNVEETKVDTPVVEEKPEEQVKPEVSSISKGTVVNCSKLNIRKGPKSDAKVITIVDAGTKLSIEDIEKAKGDWYKVITDKKVHGYCMKKYVKIN